MKLLRLVLVGVFLGLGASFSLAQSSMKYNFDYSVFAFDSTSNYIEIYYSFDKSTFQVIDSATSIKFEIVIANSNSDTLVNKYYELNDSLTFSDKQYESFGVLKYEIPQDELLLSLILIDNNDSNKTENIQYKIISENLYTNQNSISGLQLARLITSDSTNSENIFDKNNYTVIPNPSLVYNDQFPRLFFYTELYNLNSDNPLSLQQQIIDPNGTVAYDRKTSISANRKSKVQVGIINLQGLASGSYDFTLQIVDSSKNVLSSSTKRFYYYTQLQLAEQKEYTIAKDYLKSEFGVYSEEECDDLVNKLRYVATANELAQYKVLTKLDDKRNFLFQFWEKRDFDKATSTNEYKIEVMNRIEEADKRFGALKRDGATTDRGRVLILYGMPDEIDRYPNESGYKPYEIWKYRELEGGVMFVFGDILGLEDYRLLHSTKRGELSQPNWLERLRGN